MANIGDSTFYHRRPPALPNAVQQGDRTTVSKRNNYVTAMTGFQPSFACGPDGAGLGCAGAGAGAAAAPSSPAAAPAGARGLSIEQAVGGLGVRHVFSVDQFDEEATLAALKLARDGEGVNVVICNAPCVVHETRTGSHPARAPYVVDQDLCNACSLCVRVLGCPAIFVEEGKYWIDPDLCDGCDLCARVCNQDAIRQAADDDA